MYCTDLYWPPHLCSKTDLFPLLRPSYYRQNSEHFLMQFLATTGVSSVLSEGSSCSRSLEKSADSSKSFFMNRRQIFKIGQILATWSRVWRRIAGARRNCSCAPGEIMRMRGVHCCRCSGHLHTTSIQAHSSYPLQNFGTPRWFTSSLVKTLVCLWMLLIHCFE